MTEAVKSPLSWPPSTTADAPGAISLLVATVCSGTLGAAGTEVASFVGFILLESAASLRLRRWVLTYKAQ